MYFCGVFLKGSIWLKFLENFKIFYVFWCGHMLREIVEGCQISYDSDFFSVT